MPQPAEIAGLISSFTAQLERSIDAVVGARLADAFARLDVRARPALPAPGPARHKSITVHRAARASAPQAAPPARSAPPARVVELPKPKQATVIPAHIKITRLPPAPVPRAPTASCGPSAGFRGA